MRTLINRIVKCKPQRGLGGQSESCQQEFPDCADAVRIGSFYHFGILFSIILRSWNSHFRTNDVEKYSGFVRLDRDATRVHYYERYAYLKTEH